MNGRGKLGGSMGETAPALKHLEGGGVFEGEGGTSNPIITTFSYFLTFINFFKNNFKGEPPYAIT